MYKSTESIYPRISRTANGKRKRKLDKACSQHGMAFGDFKDLLMRTASDKVY